MRSPSPTSSRFTNGSSARQGRGLAEAYLDRVEARIAVLANFPDRGTQRGDLGVSVRALAFEHRLIIAYRVEASTVTVLRVVSGVRDPGSTFDP